MLGANAYILFFFTINFWILSLITFIGIIPSSFLSDQTILYTNNVLQTFKCLSIIKPRRHCVDIIVLKVSVISQSSWNGETHILPFVTDAQEDLCCVKMLQAVSLQVLFTVGCYWVFRHFMPTNATRYCWGAVSNWFAMTLH